MTKVPDLAGRSLGEVIDTFSSTEATVVVVFPADSAKVTVEATSVAGVLKPRHTRVLTFPEQRLLLSDRRVVPSKHRVVSQDPPPGAPLSQTTTITVSFGPHPESNGESWLLRHSEVVKRGGADSCFQCHDESWCSDCHVRMEY